MHTDIITTQFQSPGPRVSGQFVNWALLRVDCIMLLLMPINRGSMRKIEAFVKTWMNQSMDRASVSWLGRSCLYVAAKVFVRSEKGPGKEKLLKCTQPWQFLYPDCSRFLPSSFPTQKAMMSCQSVYGKIMVDSFGGFSQSIGLYSLLVVLAT